MSFLRSRPPINRHNQAPYQRRPHNPALGSSSGSNGTGAAGAGGGVSVKRKIETHKPTPPVPGTYTDYKLVSTTRDAMHHVMRFHGNRDVNPMSFSAPVKLQRKRSEAPHYYRNWNNRYGYYNNYNNNGAGDNRSGGAGASSTAGATTANGGSGGGASGSAGAATGVNGAGSSSAGAAGAVGAGGSSGGATSAAAGAGAPGQATAGGADISLIAPYGRGVINKQMLFKKRTKQVFLANEEERRKKEIESAPWVIEDYDSQNTFTGQLEGGQHAQYMLFVFSDDGFKVVPADKWYKFAPKIQYATLTSEEAEEQYQKYTKQANMRWLMRKKMTPKTGEEGEEGMEEDGEGDQFMAVDHEDRGFDEDEDERSRKRKRGKHGDVDEMDFEEVFQDDEEAPIDIPGFDEEDRDDPRRRNRGLGYGSEDEEEEDDAAKTKLDAQGREIRKSLLKVEKNRAYAVSDEERDPYASDKDSSDSDGDEADKEKEREKEAKKEDDLQPSATSILEKANKKKQAAAAAAAKGSPLLGKKNAAGKPVKPVSAKMMKGKAGVGAAASAAGSAATGPAGRATSPSAAVGADGRALSPPAGFPSKMRSTSPAGRSSSPSAGPSDKKKRKLESGAAEPGGDETRKQRVGSSSNLTAASIASGAGGSGGAGAPASAAVSEGPQDDSMLITEDEVVHILRTRTKITTRDLINELKKKLRKDVRNRNTLAQIIKKVASVQEGFLVLKN
ncbi:hypothetical protein DFQ27_000868 [Actinomortierella ambigua]|uniref:Transcription initiation factor IIF subunit alpha n=1 Tax=Actinomortierella ambigua TaxID=1343610 RepID=A0A9P6QBL8_9FUNG|nr:hypothetical protein DFQ27_000868 [Actinomortierella ambigua]